MGFERRGNRIYYYKKEREGDQVVSRYVGSGETASLFAEMDEIQAEENKFKRFEERQRRAKAERFEAELSEIEETFETLITGYFLANGYHQTASREWRRKRNGKR